MFGKKYSRYNGLSLAEIKWQKFSPENLLVANQQSRFSRCLIRSKSIIQIDESDLESDVNTKFWDISNQDKKLILESHHYYRIENCFLNPRHGIIFIDDHFLSETSIYTGKKRIFGKKRNKTDNYFDVPPSLFTKAKFIDKPVYALSTSPGMNYCHFNLDIASGLLPILDNILAGEIKLLWSGGFSSFHIHILEMLGITQKHILINDDAMVHCNLLIKSSTNFHAYKKSLSSAIVPYFDKIRSLCLKNTDSKIEYPDKIVLYRSPDTSRRINEWEKWDELLAWSKHKGFKLIDPGTLNIKDQVNLFNKAKFIISQHGAALTNLAYGNDKLHIIEIMPEKRLTKLFLCLSELVSAKHYVILAGAKRLKIGNDLNSFAYVTPLKEIKHLYDKVFDGESIKS